MNPKMLKGLALVTSILGLGVTILSSFVGEKQMEQYVDERINERLSQQQEEA